MLSSRQAAHRLGVKVETLYAYVSRGLLTSHRDEAHRASVFDEREVERLARRGRPRAASRTPTLDIDIATAITSTHTPTGGYEVRFRGHPAAELAATVAFEQVAELLWTGELTASPAPPWAGSTVTVAGERMMDRVRVAAALAAVEPGAGDGLAVEAVAAEGRRLIATIVDSLPVLDDGRVPRLHLPGGAYRGTIAGRLWRRLSPRRATPGAVRALNGALVLMADHELAASTLAARVAASTRAGPHAVVAAGLGAVSGRLHGGESLRVRRLLVEADGAGAAAAVDGALQRYGRLPGFGQMIYPDGDPRTPVLRALVDEAWPSSPALVTVDEVAAEARRRHAAPPNVDFALATLGRAAAMADDAAEAIFAVARIAGWLAHALEEYDERPLRFRPKATYIGR